MEGLSMAVAFITLTTVLSYIVNFVDEYRQLIATEELRYLITKVDALRAMVYWTTISIENSSRHASHSFEADFQYKAFWEDLQRIMVAFKHTTKMFNNRVHRICGKTGPKLSKNYDGLLKLQRMRSSKELFRVLQDRLSFHESCIKLLIDNITTYTQPTLLRSVDISIPTKKAKALTPQLVHGFYQGKNDYLDELSQRLKPFSIKESVQHRQMICVYGKEGAGKTHLCSKFADEHKTSYWGVFWVDPNKKCFESLNPIASRIDSVDQLSDVKEPWLLIVDNAQDLTNAEMYFPFGDKGHILVTTRSSPPKSVDSVHVSEMKFEEKKGFLLWAAGLAMPWRESEQAWADEVISQFSREVKLLTLTHVGATIRNSFVAREEYVPLLKKQQRKESKAGILQGSQNLSLKVAITQIRKQKTRSSEDAFIILMASPRFTTRYITLDTLAKSMLPIKGARKEQRLSHYTCFKQSNARAGSLKGFTSKLIRRNGKVRSIHQVSSHRKSPGSFDRLRAEWAIAKLVDMSLVLRHPSNETYSIQPAVQQWVAERLQTGLEL